VPLYDLLTKAAHHKWALEVEKRLAGYVKKNLIIDQKNK